MSNKETQKLKFEDIEFISNWKFLKDELPTIGSTIYLATYAEDIPEPSYEILEVTEDVIKDIYTTSDRRDMWAYKTRPDIDNLFGRKNVNFSLIDINSASWDKYKLQREERGFDDSELWSFDTTVAKFIAPRLRAFKEVSQGFPPQFGTFENWMSAIDDMVYWAEFVAEDCVRDLDDRAKNGKNLFFENFESIWY